MPLPEQSVPMAAFVNKLLDLHTGRAMLLGPTMDSRVAFDLIQRLPYLGLRMREHGRRAMAIASRLEDLGVPVRYPGLPSHPQHRVFQSMMNDGLRIRRYADHRLQDPGKGP